MKHKLIILFLLLCISDIVFAQDIAVDAIMRSNDKIYVVMAVVLVIVIGLLLYLINIDKKISKLE